LTVKASSGGRFDGLAGGDADDAEGLVAVGEGEAGVEPVAELVAGLEDRSGLVAVTGSSPPRDETHQASATTTTTAATPTRTQNPVSGVGAPVPGWV
jgi:hypothetical protein